MTTAEVVETSVTVNNNTPIQDYAHPDDQTQPTFEQIIVLKKFVKNCVLINLYTLKDYEICRFNKNKTYAIGQLNP